MKELEEILSKINPKDPEFRQKITLLRREMDEACATSKITVKEWRSLIDQVAALRAQSPFR